MLHWFLNLPTFLMVLIVMIIASSISFAALVIIRKKINWESFKENHEVAGFLFNALGLIYAVLIAFVVYATWDDYSAAERVCDDEANMLQNLYLISDNFPEQHKIELKNKILDYIQCVIDEDWPLLDQDKANPASRTKLLELWNIYNSMGNPASEKERIYFQESINKLDDVTNFRRLRILYTQSHIPAMIWTVLFLGAFTSVGFSLFFGTRKFDVQASMTALFAMTNGIVLLLILTLDHPFTGDIKIEPTAFQDILRFLSGKP